MVNTKKSMRMRGGRNIQRGGFEMPEMPDLTGYFGNVSNKATDMLEKAKKSTGYYPAPVAPVDYPAPVAPVDYPAPVAPVDYSAPVAQDPHMGGRKSRKGRKGRKSRKSRKHATKGKKRKSKGRGKRSRRGRR